VKANPILYRVDGERGRFRFTTYQREVGGAVVIDSERELFPSLSDEQWYLTRGFEEMAMFYGVAKRLYREATAVINRLRYVEEATPLRSLRAQSEREGAKLQAHIGVKSAAILAAHGVGKAEGAEVQEPRFGVQERAQKAVAEVIAALAACTEDAEARAEMAANPVPYEEPGQSVNIAVDEVGVKRQRATRKAEAEAAEVKSEEKKYVHTTVAHIATEAGGYVLSGLGVVALLRQMLAFLLANDLAGHGLMVFVDGQRSLHAALVKVLGCWRSWQAILEWYHLEKRCRQNLSLAIKGRLIRNQVLEHLVALLWDGRVGSALEYLAGLTSEQIKNAAERAKLIGYLERQRPHIPCYSVRKRLGLHNSSNRGEKEGMVQKLRN
jgi:hypothetical protein